MLLDLEGSYLFTHQVYTCPMIWWNWCLVPPTGPASYRAICVRTWWDNEEGLADSACGSKLSLRRPE